MFSSNPLYFIIPAPGEVDSVESQSRGRPDNMTMTQPTDKDLFPPYDTLMGGNAFRDEYRGYKNYKPGLPTPTDERQKLMLELMAYAMVAHDLGLYLDVYPTQTRLIKEFEKYSKLAADRQKAYVEKYGPLSQKDSGDKNGMMSYVATPSPWLGF